MFVLRGSHQNRYLNVLAEKFAGERGFDGRLAESHK